MRMRDAASAGLATVLAFSLAGCLNLSGDYEFDPGPPVGYPNLLPPDALPPETAEPCGSGDLVFSDGGGTASLGRRDAAIIARNASDQPCAVDGWPSLVFMDTSGQPVAGGTVVTAGEAPAPIVLLPEAAVMTLLTWRAVGGPSAPASPWIALSVDATKAPVEVAWADGHDIGNGATVEAGPWVPFIEGYFED